MHIIFLVLHPLFKDEYFKLAKWEPEWISKAIQIACEIWETQYKSGTQETMLQEPNVPPKRPQTDVLAMLSGASEARSGQISTDALSMWLAGGLHLDLGRIPVNPLKWWIAQGRCGNTHGGLIQMALDVLSCPGQIFEFSVFTCSLELTKLKIIQ
ncbi:hypothetical protein PTTG_01546 [Puccinia triticina 1-1 BBBD Race 1]|uniref:HAT C-terminal dimerisation domain-containing protein n=1 Tax=Puccinia triticina (isolate 1-1 / race 1 (BBBD)) TaxID=630390 RepID=A0A180H721_PUCT1|nr:hypothetical protein PTTG_01546 [Puccinia triticina 1-1 BBBD Race 1]